MSDSVVYTNLSVAQASELLGKWAVCRLDWEDDEDARTSSPMYLAAIVVPAPGSEVSAQFLVTSKPWLKPSGGWEYEVFLDHIKYLRVVPAPADALRLPT